MKIHTKIVSFFLLLPNIERFHKLKILSEVEHDYWKRLKLLFTGLRAGQYKPKPEIDVQYVDIWNFDIFLGQPKKTDIRWGSFWKRKNIYTYAIVDWFSKNGFFIAKSHQGWSLVCEMRWVWYFEQNISTHDSTFIEDLSRRIQYSVP